MLSIYITQTDVGVNLSDGTSSKGGVANQFHHNPEVIAVEHAISCYTSARIHRASYFDHWGD